MTTATSGSPRTPRCPRPPWEKEAQFLQRMHAEQGLDVVRLNPGFVYGPGGLLRSAFVEQARKGRLRCIGNGSNWWSCVHVDDQGRAYAAALVGARARRLLRRRRLLSHPPA